jgi:uncharacterized membrane protein YhaH (DUF805 family)
MDWTTLLFRFEGRINRARYWCAVLIYLATWIMFLIVALSWFVALRNDLYGFTGGTLAVWAVGITVLIAGTWSGLATGMKRLHDRDRSGWWMLLFMGAPTVIDWIGGWLNAGDSLVFQVPVWAITIWACVELGLLRGTDGPNRYGPDPLAPREADVANGLMRQ